MPTTTLEGSRRCAASRPTNTSFRSGRKSPNASSSTRHITSRDRTLRVLVSAKVRLVRLDGLAGPAKRASVRVDHGLTDAVRHEPGRLVGDAKRAVELVGA